MTHTASNTIWWLVIPCLNSFFKHLKILMRALKVSCRARARLLKSRSSFGSCEFGVERIVGSPRYPKSPMPLLPERPAVLAFQAFAEDRNVIHTSCEGTIHPNKPRLPERKSELVVDASSITLVQIILRGLGQSWMPGLEGIMMHPINCVQKDRSVGSIIITPLLGRNNLQERGSRVSMLAPSHKQPQLRQSRSSELTFSSLSAWIFFAKYQAYAGMYSHKI